MRQIVYCLLLVLCLAGGAQEPTSWEWKARDLTLPDGKPANWVPPETLRLYKVVDDEDARDGKALQVFIDQRRLRENDIPIVKASVAAPVGRYRVTARIKITGLLNCIGGSLRFDAGRFPIPLPPGYSGNWRSHLRVWEPTLHGYLFKDEDTWQEFSFVTEVIEPDALTQRPLRPGPVGGFGRLFSKEEVAAWKRGEGNPLDQRPAPLPAAEREQKLAAFKTGPLPVEITLLQLEELGFGRVQNSFRTISVDWLKIEKVQPEPTIVARQVLPAKCWLRPGDTQNFAVWVHNRSGAPRTATVRLRVVHDIADSLTVGEQSVEVADGRYGLLDFAWETPKDTDFWGCEAIAEIVVNGEVTSTATDVFSVHRNPWAVMNFGGASRWRNPYYEPPCYRNYQENFGITPGDALKVWPDDPDEPYVSGMSGYYTSIASQQIVTEFNSRIGVSNFLYIQPASGTGVYAAELYQQHPEWFAGPIDWTDRIEDHWRNKEDNLRRAWNAGEPPPENPGRLIIEAPMNQGVDYIFDNMLAGLMKMMANTHYDGVRWDADMPVRSWTRFGISVGPGDEDADKELSCERDRTIKRTLREQFPYYTEGANIGTPKELYNRKFQDQPEPENLYHKTFLADGSNAMAEGWMSAWIYQDARNVIRDYFWGAFRSVQWCRDRGGFWHGFPPARDGVPHFTQSIIFYNNLLPLAGGQYPGMYSCPPYSETGMGHFVTRFSGILYSLEQKPLKEARDLIRVDADRELWYDEETTWRPLPDGGRRYVIPLVNPPTIERFMIRDRFSELPEPILESFPVEIEMPEGFAGARVRMLTSEPRTAAVPLKAEVDDDMLYTEVPRLYTWAVLVVDFSREEVAR